MSGFFIILQTIARDYDEDCISFDSAGLSGGERVSVLEGDADGGGFAGMGQMCHFGAVLVCGIFAFHVDRTS